MNKHSGGERKKTVEEANQQIRLIIVAVVMFMFVVTTILNALTPTYNPPPYIGPLMLAVVGVVLSNDVIKTVKKNGSNEDGPGPAEH